MEMVNTFGSYCNASTASISPVLPSGSASSVVTGTVTVDRRDGAAVDLNVAQVQQFLRLVSSRVRHLRDQAAQLNEPQCKCGWTGEGQHGITRRRGGIQRETCAGQGRVGRRPGNGEQ